MDWNFNPHLNLLYYSKQSIAEDFSSGLEKETENYMSPILLTFPFKNDCCVLNTLTRHVHFIGYTVLSKKQYLPAEVWLAHSILTITLLWGLQKTVLCVRRLGELLTRG